MPGKFFLYPFEAGQEVLLKKAHPCGGKKWKLKRVGADVNMQCMQCGRQLSLTRAQLEKSCVRICEQDDSK